MSTEVVGTITRIREVVGSARRQRQTVGCVPTMGALHAGHGTLIERARTESDLVIVTIFVNPLQFDRKDDYERYTRDLEADRIFCAERRVDIIFAPSHDEMYPEPTATFVNVPELSEHMCGAFRPGHFRGVATVVAKLFNIVQPDVAYFGEKDAQQLAIIQRMVRDLNFRVRIVPMPTVREQDGLALSSRNRRLTPQERSTAPILFTALSEGQRLIEGGEQAPSRVRTAVVERLASEPAVRVEYVEIVDANLVPVDRINDDVRIMLAAWIGTTRLIDNVLCRPRVR